MIKRIGTARVGRGRPAFAVQIGAQTIELDHADLATHDTAAKLLTEVQRRAGRSLPLFFHYNRDGSLAVAYGAEPLLWPEDDPDA